MLVATDVAARGIHVDESAWSSRLTRRAGPRTTCTAPAVRPGPAAPAPSSPWRCRTSVASWSV